MLLVTGITGHTGSYFLEELTRNKYNGDIRCLIREGSNTSLLDTSGLNIEKVIGTLDDKESLNEVTKNIETIIHIYNIHHSMAIIQAAIENNVKKVILVHTTGVYSSFKSASETYKKIEKEIPKYIKQKQSAISVTILRPTMIYGDLKDRNVSKFIKMVDTLKVIPVINGGKNLIQPVNAADLGRAYYKALIHPNEVTGKSYNLSGEKPIQMKEFLKIISRELNKKTIFINVPLGIGVLFAQVLKLLTLQKIDYVEKVQRMGEDRSYSHKEAIIDFGYNPVLLEKGIANEVKLYLEEKNK